jgi:hypothetical protein
MLASGRWRDLPDPLAGVLSNGEGLRTWACFGPSRATGVLDRMALALVLPDEHRWPTEGNRQEAIRRSDRLLG